MENNFIENLLDWLHESSEDKINKKVKELEADIELLEDSIYDATVNGETQEVVSYTMALEKTEQLYRITRGYTDILFFAYEYFSENRNPGFRMNIIDDADMTLEMAPKFHQNLCLKLSETIKKERTKSLAWASPRGSAKTSYLTEIFPLHEIVYRSRNFIVLISETISMAKAFLKFSSDALKENTKLRNDFGEIMSDSRAQNKEDNQVAFVTVTNIRMTISSPDSQFRGMTYGGNRPDLVILDDIESKDNTSSEEKRKEMLGWFNKVIIPALDIKRGAVVYMGTIVHHDGLLPNVLERTSYDSDIFRSIISYPDDPELWETWEKIYKDNDGGTGEKDSTVFYLEHKNEMDAGIEVLWPARFSYIDLMKKKIELGEEDFNSEYQNIPPRDSAERTFDTETLAYFEQEEVESTPGTLKRMQIVSFWDPAAGENARSDYNAVITIARDIATGKIYVLDAWGKKCSYREAMKYCLEVIRIYNPDVFGVETINSAVSFYDQLVTMSEQMGLYQRFMKIKPQTRKIDRIVTMQPLFENQTIRFRRTQRLLIDMLRDFPNGKHDDLPDALASAIELLKFKKRRVWYEKPEGL